MSPDGDEGWDDLSEAEDRLAEDWLRARHDSDWYIGSATVDEWKSAYAAVSGESGSETE